MGKRTHGSLVHSVTEEGLACGEDSVRLNGELSAHAAEEWKGIRGLLMFDFEIGRVRVEKSN